MSASVMGSAGSCAKKNRLNPKRASFTTLDDRTRVQPSFRKRFEPGSPFAKGRLFALLAPVPKGCDALLSEKNQRAVSLSLSVSCLSTVIVYCSSWNAPTLDDVTVPRLTLCPVKPGVPATVGMQNLPSLNSGHFDAARFR